MIAFDTDVLSLISNGNLEIGYRLRTLDPGDFAIPVVVLEEKLRGRLNAIRQAQAGKTKISLPSAYQFLETDWKSLQMFHILSFTDEAEAKFIELVSLKLRIGSLNLRIAAICIVHSAILITRNRRDFERIPGLSADFWD